MQAETINKMLNISITRSEIYAAVEENERIPPNNNCHIGQYSDVANKQLTEGTFNHLIRSHSRYQTERFIGKEETRVVDIPTFVESYCGAALQYTLLIIGLQVATDKN